MKNGVANAPNQLCEIILLNKQAPRFDWSNFEVLPDRRRVFFSSEPLAAYLPKDANVCVVGDEVFDLDALLARVGIEVRENEQPLLATNDEYLVPVCRKAQAHLKKESIPNLTPYRDKRVMKSCVRQAGLRVPGSVDLPDHWEGDIPRLVRKAGNKIGFPLVAKPASEANSRGVSVIESAAELQDWLGVRSVGQGAILEEHIEGRLFFCDTMIDAVGSQQVLMICEYANPPHLFSQGYSHGSITLSHEDPVFERISNFNLQVLETLPEIRSTITHLEVFLTPKNDLVFLEIAARAPGAWVSRIAERHVGVNLEELNFRLQLHLSFSVSERELCHAAWLWFPLKTGTVVGYHMPKIPIQNHIERNIQTGKTYQKPPTAGPNLPENAACRVEVWDHDQRAVAKHFRSLANLDPVTYRASIEGQG